MLAFGRFQVRQRRTGGLPMRMCLVQLAIVLLLLAAPSLSAAQQSAKQTSVHFGTIIEAYEFQPGFLLTVARGPDGRPVELVVHKATLAGRGRPPNSFSQNRVDPFLNELAPPAIRGEKVADGDVVFCSGSCYETREYTRAVVTIVYNEFDPTREIIRLEIRFRSADGTTVVVPRPN
jgi:hypothetical protein